MTPILYDICPDSPQNGAHGCVDLAVTAIQSILALQEGHMMSFLKRLSSILTGGAGEGGERNAYWLYVRCDRCGEKLRLRVDRQYEIQPDYDQGGYVLRKEIMDGTCFQLMYAEVHFDPAMRVTSRDLRGGTFITAEEYAREGV